MRLRRPVGYELIQAAWDRLTWYSNAPVRRYEEARMKKLTDPDREENELIDRIEASGMHLRTVIGGFMDIKRLNDAWLKYLREVAADLREPD